MKKLLIYIAFNFFATIVCSQQKGVKALSVNNQQLSTNTYAVVIGISDYQDPAIPDLRFADKDAEAFANFLKSPAGGSLDKDHLRLLTNSNATAGKVASALYWLVDESKEADQVIIYFSGHGDVERKFIGQPGFLLCWDSPPNVYMAGGSVELGMLQAVISTLTIEKKARVLMISDACHSGKLAGSNINGSQITNANLARQFGNEIKILSCQPNEYSLEGNQWGGGRGVFSYHLVNGLYGLANQDTDEKINLKEISRYLEDNIRKETAPEKQNPVIVGDRETNVSRIFPDLLATLQQNLNNHLPVFLPVENKGLEEQVFSDLDSNVYKMYLLFKQSLDEKIFFEPVNACAEYYYEKLSRDIRLSSLHNSMRRNYAAALQDDAQQAINKLMQTEKTESRLYRLERIKKYSPYPRLLKRSIELLGQNHYLYPSLKARLCYFEGWVLQMESPIIVNPLLSKTILDKYREAIKWMPDFPLVYNQMSTVFHKLEPNVDSAKFYLYKAMEICPNCLFANYNLINYISGTLGDNKTAKNLLLESIKIDSTQPRLWTALASIYFKQSKYDSAQYFLNIALSLDTTYYDAYFWLGVLEFNGRNNQANSEKYFQKALLADKPSSGVYMYLGSIYANVNNFDKAEFYYKKGLDIEPNDLNCNVYLTAIYLKTNRLKQALKLIENVQNYDSTSRNTLIAMANAYERSKYFKEAEKIYCKVLSIDSLNADSHFRIGRFYFANGDTLKANDFYEKGMALDTSNSISYWWIADYYYKINKYLEAEHAYKRAIHFDSTNIIYHNSLGWFYYLIKQYTKAEAAYENCIRIDSSYFLAWINLGLIYNKTNRYKEGEHVFLKAISIDSMRVNSWLNLSYSYSGLGQYENMRIACLRALSLHSNNVKAWQNLGIANSKLKHFDDSKNAYLKAISIDSLNSFSWASLGYFYIETKEYSKSEFAFKKAVALDSNNVYEYNSLAWLYTRINRRKDAEKIYLKSISLDSSNTLALNNLGWLYIHAGRYNEAMRHFTKAISIDSAFVNPITLLAFVKYKINLIEDAKFGFRKALQFQSDFGPALFGMVYLYTASGQHDRAFEYLEQAILVNKENIIPNIESEVISHQGLCLLHSLQGLAYDMLQQDEELASLRLLPEWNNLMKKYFPDKK